MEETHLRTHRQTVRLGVIKAAADLFPGCQLKTAYSIQGGDFCNLSGSIMSEREVAALAAQLDAWVAAGGPIRFLRHENGYFHYDVDGLVIKVLYPAEPSASRVDPHRIVPYGGGFIVDYGEDGKVGPFVAPEKLAATFEKTQHWLRNVGLEQVGDVNAMIDAGRGGEMIGLAEALQEKEIADIADLILLQRRALRVLLISGPSSSGKTSFAQRLAMQLRVNGLMPVPVSLDDFFVDRERTPRDAAGKPDFESLEALDLALLQRQVADLIAGRAVELPRFDFVEGRRRPDTRPLRLGPREILVLEGIHALNPHLLPEINRGACWRIYINALFQLNIDLLNRVPTSEVRLVRRIVRGERFRGTAPGATIGQWPGVRRGEHMHVFRHQEEADVMFNSGMIYELHALRPVAEEVLRKIPDGDPHAPTRDRLLNLLGFFHPIDTARVPPNSILREFLGGSVYFESGGGFGGAELPH